MSGAAVFGIWGAVAYGVLIQLAPQPAGSIVYWSANAALLTWGATLCWRRMRLPYAAASMAVVAVASSAMVGFAWAGDVMPSLPWSGWTVLGVSLVLGGILYFIESRVHREVWLQWKADVERASAWDAIRGRHIPTLHASAKTTDRQ